MKSNQSTFRESVEQMLPCYTGCAREADPADGFNYCTCGEEKRREAITLAHEEAVKKELETIKGLTVRYIEYAGNKIVLAINPKIIEDRIRELSNE